MNATEYQLLPATYISVAQDMIETLCYLFQLLEPDKELEVGKIRDSNRITLVSALQQHGFKVFDLGIAKDS